MEGGNVWLLSTTCSLACLVFANANTYDQLCLIKVIPSSRYDQETASCIHQKSITGSCTVLHLWWIRQRTVAASNVSVQSTVSNNVCLHTFKVHVFSNTMVLFPSGSRVHHWCLRPWFRFTWFPSNTICTVHTIDSNNIPLDMLGDIVWTGVTGWMRQSPHTQATFKKGRSYEDITQSIWKTGSIYTSFWWTAAQPTTSAHRKGQMKREGVYKLTMEVECQQHALLFCSSKEQIEHKQQQHSIRKCEYNA